MNAMRILLIAVLSISLEAARADIVTLSTAYATRPTVGEIRAFLGPIGAGGPQLAVLDGLTLTGTAVVDANLSPEGNGTVQMQTADLLVSDVIDRTIDLGPLGTVHLTATGLRLNIRTSPINVQSNQFIVTAGTGGGITVIGGSLQIFNLTGLIGSILPNGYVYDFDSSPLFQTFFLIDPPIQGTFIETDEQSVLTLGFPEFAFNNPLIANGSEIGYLQFAIGAQLATAVPESRAMQTISLLAMGLFCHLFIMRYPQRFHSSPSVHQSA